MLGVYRKSGKLILQENPQKERNCKHAVRREGKERMMLVR